jgi:hypothetical protein
MGLRELLVVCGCLGFALPAMGQQRRFGTWTVGESDGSSYVYAVTFSDSGNVLGLYCDVSQNQCIWALGMKTSCASDADARYPALMNSPAGAFPLELVCGGLDDRGFYRYAFADYASAAPLVSLPSVLGRGELESIHAERLTD